MSVGPASSSAKTSGRLTCSARVVSALSRSSLTSSSSLTYLSCEQIGVVGVSDPFPALSAQNSHVRSETSFLPGSALLEV